MANYVVSDASLSAVADAIREKGGTSAPLAFPADFVSAIEAISGGDSGVLELLASGTYNRTSTATSLTIPVSYTGNGKYAVVVADEPEADTAQCLVAIRAQTPITPGITDVVPHGFTYYVGINASNTKATGMQSISNTNLSSFTATQIQFARQTTSYTWKQTSYKWYIYGEKTA